MLSYLYADHSIMFYLVLLIVFRECATNLNHVHRKQYHNQKLFADDRSRQKHQKVSAYFLGLGIVWSYVERYMITGYYNKVEKVEKVIIVTCICKKSVCYHFLYMTGLKI